MTQSETRIVLKHMPLIITFSYLMSNKMQIHIAKYTT